MKRWALALAVLGSIGCGENKETPKVTGTPDPTVSETDLATATAMALNTPTDGLLADPVTARVFFKFAGKAGEFVDIKTATTNERYDASYVDTIATLYDANRVMLARNDDSFPRLDNGNSQILFRIPVDGTYYVSVGGCATLYGTDLCGDGKETTHLDFRLSVGTNLFAEDGAVASTQQDGTKAKADSIRYKAFNEYNDYFLSNLVGGAFTKAGETQVFTFTAPSTIWVMEGLQAWARFSVMPVGATEGNGSTANIRIWAEDAAGNRLAEADQNNYGAQTVGTTNAPLYFAFPVTLGQPYFLFVQSTATVSHPESDFYVMSHWTGQWGAMPEAEPANESANNESDNAELYSPGFAYQNTAAVVGTLPAATDVDWFVADVPEGFTKVRDFCYAQRYGSGVRGFTASYIAEDKNGDPTELTALAYTEAANVDPRRMYLTLPEGTVKIYARYSATSIDPTVQSRFYSCTLYFK